MRLKARDVFSHLKSGDFRSEAKLLGLDFILDFFLFNIFCLNFLSFYFYRLLYKLELLTATFAFDFGSDILCATLHLQYSRIFR